MDTQRKETETRDFLITACMELLKLLCEEAINCTRSPEKPGAMLEVEHSYSPRLAQLSRINATLTLGAPASMGTEHN